MKVNDKLILDSGAAILIITDIVNDTVICETDNGYSKFKLKKADLEALIEDGAVELLADRFC